MNYSIKYPRKIVIRSLFRLLARAFFPLLARSSITGLDKFPRKGPLIIVGNHTGAMEVVLMATYSSRLIEFMGAMEMPWNGWMGAVVDLYGVIPVFRGYLGRETLRKGLDTLKQNGMLGIFPEGGFWEPGHQKVQPGVAWMSYMANAPILPIGFGDTRGKMAKLLRFERPHFEMNVGDVLPPVQLDPSISKKAALEKAANQIMDAVWALVPEEEKKRKAKRPSDEIFKFDIEVFDSAGRRVPIPADLALDDGSWISRFAHRPNLIDSIRDYIFIPVQVLKELDRKPDAEEIYQAAHSMLEYVENENPQYFNYRYGVQGGEAFHHSFRQLRRLMLWVMENDFQVEAEVHYEFTDPDTGEHRVLRVPEEVEQW